jgi:hypothetical protein
MAQLDDISKLKGASKILKEIIDGVSTKARVEKRNVAYL